jgi:hypothetical protein
MRPASAKKIGGFLAWMLVGLTYGWLAPIYHLPRPPLLWFLAGLAIGIASHEAGHVVCAILAKRPLRLVSIGVGPRLLSRRMGETKLEWRLLPFAGIVLCYPEFVRRQLATTLFLLGGVIANVILVGMAGLVELVGAATPAARTALGAMIFVQVLLIGFNLLPHRMTISGTRIGSDGLQLLQLFFWPANEWSKRAELYTTQLKRYSSSGKTPPIEAPHSARVFYQMNRPDRWADEATRHEVQDALIRELERGGLSDQEEMLVLDALLTYGLVCDDPELRLHLDQWSTRALALGPDIGTLLGTRGAVLVSLGRHEEGKALLSTLPRASGNAPFDAMFDKLMNQIFLARAELALGNGAIAQNLIGDARSTATAIGGSPTVALLMARLEPELQSPLSS